MKHTQRMVVADAIQCVVFIIVMLQLWLLTATMERYLGGDTAIIVPAAVASAGCFGLIFGLLYFYGRKLNH